MAKIKRSTIAPATLLVGELVFSIKHGEGGKITYVYGTNGPPVYQVTMENGKKLYVHEDMLMDGNVVMNSPLMKALK